MSSESPKVSDFSGQEVKLLMRLSGSSTTFKKADSNSDFDLSKSVSEAKDVRDWHEQSKYQLPLDSIEVLDIEPAPVNTHKYITRNIVIPDFLQIKQQESY